MSEEAIIHILREARQSEEENMTMTEMRKKMPPCPICGRKAYLEHFIVDGFDFGYGAGCPKYCLDDGIHGISDCDDPRAPKVDGYSKEQVYEKWLEYFERMAVEKAECCGCQYWDGATCMNPMSGSYGRDTDEGCEVKEQQ